MDLMQKHGFYIPGNPTTTFPPAKTLEFPNQKSTPNLKTNHVLVVDSEVKLVWQKGPQYLLNL